MKKRVFAFMLAMVMVAGLAGCGSKDSGNTSGKKWIIATDTAFKPFEYTDDSGKFVGIDVDILDAVAKDQGFDYELRSLGWDASIAACQWP